MPKPSDESAGWPEPHRGTDVDVGLQIERARGAGGLLRFSHEAMATIFEVHVVHRDREYASQAARAAFDVADRLEAELSRFIPNSDIARVNNLSAGDSTQVRPSTLECLLVARHLFDLTGGAFDVSMGTGLPLLDLDRDDFMVRASTDGVRVDLGGIGKGYAVDLMAEVLEEWGLTSALVHGGFSSLLALEPPAGGEGWPLTLSDPGSPSRVLTRLTVRQTALGASGVRKGDHIVDPRSGAGVRTRAAAWVAVRRPEQTGAEASTAATPRVAAVADALTTAFMILSFAEIEGLWHRNPEFEAWILPSSGTDRKGGTSLLHFGGAAD